MAIVRQGLVVGAVVRDAEQRAARHELVEREPQGPDVGFLVDGEAEDRLRGAQAQGVGLAAVVGEGGGARGTEVDEDDSEGMGGGEVRGEGGGFDEVGGGGAWEGLVVCAGDELDGGLDEGGVVGGVVVVVVVFVVIVRGWHLKVDVRVELGFGEGVDVAVEREEDVARLDVPVHDAVRVEEVDREDELSRRLAEYCQRQGGGFTAGFRVVGGEMFEGLAKGLKHKACVASIRAFVDEGIQELLHVLEAGVGGLCFCESAEDADFVELVVLGDCGADLEAHVAVCTVGVLVI